MRLIVLVYTAVVVTWNTLRFTRLATWAPFEVADLWGWALLVPIPFLALLAVVRRRWSSVVVLAVPGLIFAVEYGPQFAPHRVPVGDPLRIVSANLYYLNQRPDELAPALLRTAADVIAVQELSVDFSAELERALRARYPHRALYPSQSEGMGLFSRFPILAEDRPDMSLDACRCQVLRLAASGGPINVINAHPRRPAVGVRGFDSSHQVPTVLALLRRAREVRYPALVVGDFNIADRHPLYRTIRNDLGDSYRDAGWGLGLTWAYRRRLPLVRIDHVFHDEHWATRVARTAEIPGSDHRMVVADVVRAEP